MRSAITQASIDEYKVEGHDVLPLSTSVWRKLGYLFGRPRVAVDSSPLTKDEIAQSEIPVKSAGVKQWVHSRMKAYCKAHRRDSFFYAEGLGYLPERVMKRHGAFLLYHKQYYQAIDKANKQKAQA